MRGRIFSRVCCTSRERPLDRVVVEPVGDGALLGFLHALDGALLLQQVAFVLDFGFDRLEFVAEFGRKSGHGLARIPTDLFSFKKSWVKFAEGWSEVLDGDLRPLQELGAGLADGSRQRFKCWGGSFCPAGAAR